MSLRGDGASPRAMPKTDRASSWRGSCGRAWRRGGRLVWHEDEDGDGDGDGAWGMGDGGIGDGRGLESFEALDAHAGVEAPGQTDAHGMGARQKDSGCFSRVAGACSVGLHMTRRLPRCWAGGLPVDGQLSRHAAAAFRVGCLSVCRWKSVHDGARQGMGGRAVRALEVTAARGRVSRTGWWRPTAAWAHTYGTVGTAGLTRARTRGQVRCGQRAAPRPGMSLKAAAGCTKKALLHDKSPALSGLASAGLWQAAGGRRRKQRTSRNRAGASGLRTGRKAWWGRQQQQRAAKEAIWDPSTTSQPRPARNTPARRRACLQQRGEARQAGGRQAGRQAGRIPYTVDILTCTYCTCTVRAVAALPNRTGAAAAHRLPSTVRGPRSQRAHTCDGCRGSHGSPSRRRPQRVGQGQGRDAAAPDASSVVRRLAVPQGDGAPCHRMLAAGGRWEQGVVWDHPCCGERCGSVACSHALAPPPKPLRSHCLCHAPRLRHTLIDLTKNPPWRASWVRVPRR